MLKAAHIPGCENTLADCLRRWHTNAMYQSRFHALTVSLICSQLQLTLGCFPSPALNLLAFNIGILLQTLQNPWSITLVCSRNQHSVKERCVHAEHSLEPISYFVKLMTYQPFQ